MTSWFRRRMRLASESLPPQAHMTFGQTTVGRSLSRTGLFLKKQLWIWPIFAIVLLAAVGWSVRGTIERTMAASLESELKTLVKIERAMLESWLATQEANTESLANDLQVRTGAIQLLAASQAPEADLPADLPPSDPRAPADLARVLDAGMTSHQFVSYIVADRRRKIIASHETELVGRTIPRYESFLTRALDGQTTVSVPFRSVVQSSETNFDTPTMFVAAPIRDTNLQTIAVLAMRIRPDREFTRILHLGQIGKSGETYAFDKTGLMVSNSRFDEDLILLGVLPDTENSRSILTVSIRDPGVNMQEGKRPTVRRSELPLTKIVADAIAGKSGVRMDSYNDYRGVPSVGAYEWLPKYEMGLLTEIDVAEAFHPLTILKRLFYGLFALLTLSSLAIFVFTLVVARVQRDLRKAAVEAKQLGQYRLEEKLGAGAMGVVYRGQHAMLRRSTAIKLLDVDKVTEASVQRFEREVQVTCMLNNPSTIAIYDYGRTPEGVFYYAMEFLDGINLQLLVDQYGPQPEGRVVRILTKICSSLSEAHALGLVHRDIKPANIMLNRRGGEADVVKVLDFGLVKALDDERQLRQSTGLAGTPLYMSPESIQTPHLTDARSDLYAVGAVGYFLLTGHPVFSASSLAELCQLHASSIPELPSQRLGRPVSTELECVLLACLEKNCAKRPQTARELAGLLSRVSVSTSWTDENADSWWGAHERHHGQALTSLASWESSDLRAGKAFSAGSTARASTRSSAQVDTETSGLERTLES